jgi:two-component system cell cycle sensor histidine kinase/response regulator CckA
VHIERYPKFAYLNFDHQGYIIKSKWPFIPPGTNLFEHILAPEKLESCIDAGCGTVLEVELNSILCTAGFLPGEQYSSLIDLSPILPPGTLRLQTLGSMTAQVAHDFNNLLTGIMGFCEILESQNVRHRELRYIKTNAHQAADLVRRVLGWAKPGTREWKTILPYRALAQMRPFLRCIVGNKARIKLTGTTKGAIRIPSSYFEEILTNLAVNARDAINQSGTQNGIIEIELYQDKVDRTQWVRGTAPAGDYMILRVQDNGAGIPPGKTDSIFQRSYSTKRNGTGQGLSIIVDLVAEIKGFIRVGKVNKNGAVFEIGFPLYSATISCARAQPTTEQKPTITGKILVVEDDQSIREIVASALKHVGHTVFVAKTLADGMEQLRTRKPEIVITDSALPDGNGTSFVDVEHICGHTTLLASGYSQEELFQDEELPCEFMAKPFTLGQLRDRVAQMLIKKRSTDVY